ncbi:flavodoxin family protein [Saccharibacillus alkalitolerans]|uniref:Flavodoxin family protein n=1 Tax=Saccharibacillus alkalitolerans TaxID=2705290 RepID=A0ABX0FC28_9BACL|nr:flavodoxin family protein [Saccharibacillus alkalitolerans]NGZ76811.1 flavodoxin family protein [Saccharibacillus alkalitolerans]
MKMIVHDLEEAGEISWLREFGAGQDVIGSEDAVIRHCTGCFGCWTRTPGTCVLKDEYRHLGARLAVCDEMILISRCTYGGYSPFVCNVMNRTLSYVLPYFRTLEGQTHHQPRYEQAIRLTACFYGENMTEKECGTARSLVRANALNLGAERFEVSFYDNVRQLKEALA